MAQKSMTVNPLAAAMIGAAVGAAAVALSNKGTRDKITKAAHDLPKGGQKTINDIRDRVLHMIQKEEQQAQKQIRTIKKKVSRAKTNGHARHASA